MAEQTGATPAEQQAPAPREVTRTEDRFIRRGLAMRRIAVLLIVAVTLSLVPVPAMGAEPAATTVVVDWDRTLYYPQAGGYLVQNDDAAQFLTAFRALGGLEVLGPPISRRFACGGFTCQAFLLAILQWQGTGADGHAEVLNLMDLLHDRGVDPTIEKVWQVPQQVAFDEKGQPWEKIVASRQALLTAHPALARRYADAPGDPIVLYGLPSSPVVERDTFFAIRLQRAVFLEKKDTARASGPEHVEVLWVGDIARQMGLVPKEAAAADPAPPPPSGEHWIRVSLSQQRTWGMIGDRAVYRAEATTGKPSFPTPPGTYYIYSRIPVETMDSATLGIPRDSAEGYYLKDIHFTQYFLPGGYALHANYWQPDSVFGRYATSHGCVGLRYADAEFFWNFAEIGTRVVVEP